MSNLSSKEVGLIAVLSPKTPSKSAKGKEENADFSSLLNSFNKSNLSDEEIANIQEQVASLNIDNKAPKTDLVFDKEELLSSFMQILGLLELLQMDSKDVKLNNFAKLLKDNNIDSKDLQPLKEAKDIKDLLIIAKKLDLNIKAIKIEKLADVKAFKEHFPKLSKKGFFKSLEKEINIINKKNIAKISPTSKEELKKEALGELLNKIEPKLEKIKDVKPQATLNLEDIKTNKETKANIELKDIKEISKDKKELEKEGKNIEKNENKSSFKEQLLKNEPESKELENKEPKKQELKPVLEEKPLNNEPKKAPSLQELKQTVPLEKTSSKAKEEDKKEGLIDIKEELKEIKEPIKEGKNELEKKEKKQEIKPLKGKKQAPFIEEKVKIEPKAKDLDIKQVNTQDFQVAKNIELNPSIFKELKELNNKKEGLKNNKKELNQLSLNKEPKKDFLKELLSMNTAFKTIENEDKLEERLSLNENKNSLSKNNDDLNNILQGINKELNNKPGPLPIKETLNHFAKDLQEAAKEYKAPFTKLNISLNPNNLGEVEVTLVQRGNNLHISFASNTNTMQLFLANQAEFKGALVNMGFDELQMNFSDKKEQGGGEHERKDKYYKDEFENEEEVSSFEIDIAKYF